MPICPVNSKSQRAHFAHFYEIRAFFSRHQKSKKHVFSRFGPLRRIPAARARARLSPSARAASLFELFIQLAKWVVRSHSRTTVRGASPKWVPQNAVRDPPKSREEPPTSAVSQKYKGPGSDCTFHRSIVHQCVWRVFCSDESAGGADCMARKRFPRRRQKGEKRRSEAPWSPWTPKT